jgi:hypothetical protein
MATIGQSLTSPETGWRRYDERNPFIIYDENWSEVSESSMFSNTGKGALTNKNSTFKFKFFGTKLRLIASISDTYTKSIEVDIDGEKEVFSAYNSSYVHQRLVYEKMGLESGIHIVTVKVLQPASNPSAYDYRMDAIDIGSDGRLLHMDEVIEIADLKIGGRIRCHYSGISGNVGTFSDLGKETSEFISPMSSATPNGDFYYIAVDRDHLGRMKLIADRNIQHSISWDVLNDEGIAYGLENGHLGGWNPNDKSAGIKLSEMGHKSIHPNEAVSYMRATSSKKSGKHYWEVEIISSGTNPTLLIGAANTSAKGGVSSDSRTYYQSTGNKYPGAVSYGQTFTDGDTIGIKLDMDAKTLEFLKNGVSQGLAFSDLGSLGEEVFAYLSQGANAVSSNVEVRTNFGQRDFKYDLPEGYEPYFRKDSRYKFITRLLTGGINASDKENEWDEYIVNSDLNNLIIAGDNNVWNWDGVGSWTNTSDPLNSSYRMVRGKWVFSGSVKDFFNAPAGNLSNGSYNVLGFRPVLLVETLWSKINKFLLKIGTQYKSWKENIWTTVSDVIFPTAEEFTTNGMDNLNFVKDIDLTELGVDPEVVMFTNDLEVSTVKADISYIPKPQIVRAMGDIDLGNVFNITSFESTTETAGTGRVLYVVSADSGATWNTFDGTNFVPITSLTEDVVGTSGFDGTTLSSIPSVKWDSFVEDTKTIRFAYYLELNDAGDTALVDELVLKYQNQGYWESMVHGTDYNYLYPSNEMLRVKLFNSGDFKINYFKPSTTDPTSPTDPPTEPDSDGLTWSEFNF